jgi:hypothetical protein
MRGAGCGASANEYNCTHGAQINFGDLTPYLTYDCKAMRIARPTHMRKCPCRRTATAGLPTIRRKSRDAVRGKDERADKDAKVDKDARDEKTAKDTKDTHAGIPEMDNREWRPLPPASPSSVIS